MNPLAKKLQIKPKQHWLFVNAPEDYLAFLEPLPDGVVTHFENVAECDGIQLFAKDSSELGDLLKSIKAVLEPETVVWISFPKKNTTIPTDLGMDSSWAEAAKYNLRPVASAAINKTWTALRFKPNDKVKLAEFRNSEIPSNRFSEYIDVKNKVVTLPSDALAALQKYPAALNRFNDLAYSHKKEYVVWIVDAKQEKTRIARIEKTVEMLLSGKKNPSDKKLYITDNPIGF